MVEARGLGKSFGSTFVLASVDLELNAGRGVAILGANGAGKSTLVRIIAGLTAPSMGRVAVFGEPSTSLGAEKRRRLGLLTHQSFLYPNLTARENLEFFARLYGVDGPATTATEWLGHVGLGAVADRRVRGLSRGMEQRLAFARAMLAAPALLLLDEPFAALDRDGVMLVTAMVTGAMARGCAVLLTAHRAPDLANLDFDLFELVGGRLKSVEKQGGLRARLRPLLGR